MKPYSRAERVSTKIQLAITDLLSKKLQNPKLEMATVTRVTLSSDLRTAQVYISVFGDKNRSKEVLEAFQISKGFIKKNIAPKLKLKYMPELIFIYDDFFDKAAKMDEVIKLSMVSDDH
jgi:ribosome-binding factor A